MKKYFLYIISFCLLNGFLWALSPLKPKEAFAFFSSKEKATPLEVSAPTTYSDKEAISVNLRASSSNMVTMRGLRMFLPSGSLKKDVRLSIRRLKERDLISFPHSLVNLTQGSGGYSFRPRNIQLQEEAELNIAYDKTKIPEGYTEKDVAIFYYDYDKGHWQQLLEIEIDKEKNIVKSKTKTFSDFIAGIIKLPESPDTSGFMPTSISGLKAANPLGGVQSIAPPTANAEGSATTSFNIELSQGRGGMQPNISLHYSSDGGHSWLGQGWNLSLPSVSIDTRWGAPRYDEAKETESYTLAGEELLPNTHRVDWEDRSANKRFYPRREASFSKIIRKGDSPKNYHWAVSSKSGITSYYGTAADSKLQSAEGNIGYWGITSQEDLKGNNIQYEYEKVDGVLYPKAIYYTGHQGDKGKYSVRFITDHDLGETLRHDVQISARLGFKQEYKRLLRKIEVRYRGAMVRSYELIYKKGAYEKTLLSEIKQYDAESKEFYANTLSYYDDVRDASGNYIPFGELKKWEVPRDRIDYSFVGIKGFSGNPTLAGTSRSESKGVNYRFGVGSLKGKFNEFTIGGGGNNSWGKTESKVSLQDIDGDNLPDKIYKKGNNISYRKNISAQGVEKFSDEVQLIRLPSLGITQSYSYGYGVDLQLQRGMIGYNRQISKSTTESYFMDFNGDGLVDFVDNGRVYYNRLENGVPTFQMSSTGTPAPVVGGGDIQLMAPPTVDKAELEKQNPLHDIVRVWVAPHTGEISIRHEYQLIEDFSQDRKEYKNNDGTPKADGVVLFFQHNQKLSWKEKIGAEDYAKKQKTETLNVRKGDVLYFRLNSNYDGNFDTVSWIPEIQYKAIPASTQDINHLSLKQYNPKSDTLYASGRGLIFANTTQPSLKGILNKGNTTDRVFLRAYKTILATGVKSLVGEQIFSEQATTFDLSLFSIGIFQANEQLTLSIESETEIDWRAISLTPEITYTDALGNPATEKINVDFGIYDKADEHYLPKFIIPTQEGKLNLDLSVPNQILEYQGKRGNGEILITSKQEGKVVGRKRYAVNNGLIVPNPLARDVINQEVLKDKELFVELTISNKELQKALANTPHKLAMSLSSSANGIPTLIHQDYKDYAVYIPFEYAPITKFGKLFRGWGGFILNGNLAGDIIDESKLEEKVGEYDENNPPNTDPNQFDPKKPQPNLEISNAYFIRLSTDYNAQMHIGMEPDMYISGAEMSSSRLGENDLMRYLDTSLPILQGGVSRALSIVTESKSNSYSAGGGLGAVGFGGSYSEGESLVKQSMNDFNGDRFPDFIRGGQIQFTTPRGGISQQIGNIGDFTHSKTETFGGSVDGAYAHGEAKTSLSISIGKSKSQQNSTTTQGGQDAKKASNSASISGNLSKGNDYAEHTYTDMNGDGLADRITKGSIAYNTGYGFLPKEVWNFEILYGGQSFDFGAGLGYSTFGGSFKGGLNYSRSTSQMDSQFLDVTGDGLADKLVYTDQNILIYQNLGNQFSTQAITLPKIGRVAENNSISYGGGLTFSIPIELRFIGIRFSITAGGSYGTNTNRMEATFMDVDGDGHLDYVLSEDEDDLRVARSNFRRTNMLKGVENAVGNSWEIDYEWKAPTYENPNSQWVLKEVKLFDGHTGDGEDYSISKFEYENPYYDRRERTFYGFEKIKQHAINPKDNSILRTSVQEFFNRDYFRKSVLKYSAVLDKNGAKLSETSVKYHIANARTGARVLPSELFLPALDSESIFIAPSENTERSYEGTAYLEQKTLRTYDQNGNITQFVDEGNGTPESKLTANISYYESQSPYFGGIARSLEVRDDKGLVRKREAEINPATAELIKVKNYFSDTEFAQTDLTYDKFGNLKSVTGAENEKGQRAKLEYEYDAETHSHITKIKDQFGYENTMAYDYRFNTPIKTTDRNGETMLYTLDAKGRTSTILAPKEAKAGKVYTIKYQYEPIAYGVMPTAITKNYDPEHDRDIETYTYADGLGRVVQIKKTAAIFKGKGQPDEEKHIVSGKQIYDALGRVVETYYPTTAPITANGYQQVVSHQPPSKTQYDDKHRAIVQTFPDGSTTKMAYSIEQTAVGNQLKSETTDALGRVSKVYTDARGRKTKVVQPTGIETLFEYSAIGELLKVTDAESHETFSEYDLLGRRTKLIHPDAGTTTLAYDKASNLIRRQTSQIRDEMPNASIIYNYDFNRLQEIKYPKYPENNVRYHYGKQEQSPSRRGRLWLVEDGSGGTEYFYGDMGEVEKEIRTLRIKPTEVQTYVTEYGYDSWNRIQKMVYPDGEVLDFGYNIAGKLTSVEGFKPNASSQQPMAYRYLKQQGYDEFEQKIYRRLGNDTETTYTYDPLMRRLETLSSEKQDTSNQFQNNRYSYDLVGNILSVENAISQPPSAISQLGGSSRYAYEYDELNRLLKARGEYRGSQSQANYTLKMSYNSLNGIVKKELTHQINGQDKGYTLDYEYNNPKHPHAPSLIANSQWPTARSYEYDGNGNPIYYDEFKGHRAMLWDEENRLRGLNDNGKLHLYSYYHTGERALKSSAESSMTMINGATTVVITHTDDYTAYVSPYFVVNKGKFTKHFFEGSSRIVSKLGEGTFVHKNKGIMAGGIDYLALTAKMQQARDEYIKRLSLPPGPPTQHGIYATPEWMGEAYPSIDWQEILQNQEPPEGWPRPPKFNEPGDVPGPPVQFGDPITPESVKAGYGFVNNGVEERNLYFYHPDHLGSSSYITDKEGRIIQHTEYMAFGEVLFDEHLVNPKQPYLFNGKELDFETGLYYYGARYYDPKVSLWLNVDPLVEKTGTPYAYTYNNPVNLIDPTGMESDGWIEQISGGKKSYTYDVSINSIEDARKAGYENVTDVFSSGNIRREATLGFGGYDYRLNENGSVTDTNSGDTIYNTFTTGAGSTINALQGTFISEAKMDFIDQWANSNNMIAKFSYNLLNDAYITAQVFDFGLMERPEWNNPYVGGNFGNLDGTPNYNQTNGVVNTISNLVPVARGSKAIKGVMPQSLTIASKLNAAQFSKAFKGTAIDRVSAKTRGLLNRGLNKAINFINGKIENGMQAKTIATGTGKIIQSQENKK